MNCKNCNTLVNENYCPNCGQPSKLKRIDGHYIVHEIGQILNFQKGIFYTIRELLIKPGDNVRSFILDNRNRLVKPIIFIIVTSLIYTLVNNFFHIEEGYVKYDEIKKSSVGLIFNWFQNNYGYGNIFMGVFIALFTKLFFRKYSYNFYEILILLCFVMGMGMLIFAFFGLLQGLTKFSLMGIGGVIGFVYITWAIAQFFDKKKPVNYLKAFVSYVLGALISMLLLIGIGVLIDIFIK